jgi:hypothetical protein
MFYRGNKRLIEVDAQAPLEMRLVQTDYFSELSKNHKPDEKDCKKNLAENPPGNHKSHNSSREI